MKKILFILALIIVLLNSFTISSAAISLNREFNVATTTGGLQRSPAIAYAQGVFLLAWQEGYSSPGQYTQIRCLRISDTGAVLDDGSFLVSGTSNIQESPSIATDGNNFFIVWQDLRNGADYDVYGARVTPQGQVLDPKGILIASGKGNQSYPTVSFDGTNYVVAWMDNRSMAQAYSIYAGRVASNGTVLDSNGGRVEGDTLSYLQSIFNNSNGMPVRGFPKISCSHGECVIGWVSMGTAGDNPGGWSQNPKIADIRTSSGISVKKVMQFNINRTVFGGNGEGQPVGGSPSRFFGSAENGVKHMLIYSADQGKDGHSAHIVAGVPYTNGSAELSVSNAISLRPWAAGLQYGTSAASFGAGFISFWAVGKSIKKEIPFNQQQNLYQPQYELDGATIDSGNNVSRFTVFSGSATYRGFPQVASGTTHGLIVYERDMGTSGIGLSGFMFSLSGLSWTVSTDENPLPVITALMAQADLPYGVTGMNDSREPATTGIPSPVITTLMAQAALPSGVTGINGSQEPVTTGTQSPVITALTVQEALPSLVTGIKRSQEPVTIGIPLALNSGVTSVSQLGLSGVTAGQFRVLARHPNGNIKWVLADFQADVTANSTNNNISLITGTGNFGGVNLATDNGTNITVNTGAANFNIIKANFNVFNSVTVGNRTLVTSGNVGGVRAKDYPGGVQFSSLNDPNSTAVIEENGPVRTVIKATGILKNPAGTRLVDYILRMHFYKNKAYVKAFVTIANTNDKDPAHKAFQNFELLVPLSIGTGKTAEYARAGDSVTINLQPGDASHLFQGFSNGSAVVNADNCRQWDVPLPFNACNGSTVTWNPPLSEGLEIKNNSTSLNAMGNLADWSQGYAGIKDSAGNGVGMSLRWLASNWPGGFEIRENGETSIELYSKYNLNITQKILLDKHENREILWDFYTNGKANSNALYELQYPLIARAPLSYYQKTKAIMGQSEFATAAQETRFFSEMGFNGEAPDLSNPIFPNPALTDRSKENFYRWWTWPLPGGVNQTDFPLNDLQDFLRTGSPGFYLAGEQRTIFNDSQIPHGTSYTGTAYTVNVNDQAPGYTGISSGWIDMEHANIGSTPFYYFLTGNELIRDGYNDYGAYLDRAMYSYFNYDTSYFRAWSRKYRNLALLYEFSCETGTCNSGYRNYLETATANILDTIANPSTGSLGRDLSRGYIYRDPTVTFDGINSRFVHSFFHTQIHFEAMYQALRVFNDWYSSYARIQGIKDYMSGLAHFFFDEYYDTVQTNQYPHRYGILYDYPVDLYWSPTAGRIEFDPYDASRPAVWLYQQTGNANYLSMAGKLTAEITHYATVRSPSELQDQALIYTYYNQSTTPIWKTLNITVTNNGNGSYTLSWTVPQGAARYQIKYSNTPIVEWLNFNKVNRTYQYDPSQYTAFFAAGDLSSNPAPQTGGTTQQTTVRLDPTKQWYFSAKYTTAAGGTLSSGENILSSGK